VIYFAYGSNTSVEHMRTRCPDAVPLGKFWLRSARLVFRGVADCIHEPGARCPGVLYRITPECERELDRYEGIGSGAYKKVVIPMTGFPGEEKMMLYVMNSTGIFPPSERYLKRIRQGYRDHGLPMRYLNNALAMSWDSKAPSHRERQRYMRDGRPTLARLSSKEEKPGQSNTGNLFDIQKEA
jgi:gamma-glutamylcyclotransferase